MVTFLRLVVRRWRRRRFCSVENSSKVWGVFRVDVNVVVVAASCLAVAATSSGRFCGFAAVGSCGVVSTLQLRYLAWLVCFSATLLHFCQNSSACFAR